MSSDTSDTQQTTALRRCEYPQCPGGTAEWRNLKRCAACAGAWYCSRECQKAAWPLHKPLCRYINREAEAHRAFEYEGKLFGFDSSGAFSQAVHDYMEAHRWAFHNAITMHILVKSGIDMTVARQMPPQEIIKFRLVCQTTYRTPRANRHPASMFKVVEHGFVPLADFALQNPQLCTDMLQQCTHYDANIRSTSPAAPDPLYVGVIPVMYAIDGLSMHQASIFPVYRPPNTADPDDEAKTHLKHLIRLCVYSTGTAFPLRALSDDRPHYAVPGRLTRTKQWTWEALFTDWRDYYEGRTDCERLPRFEELGLEDNLPFYMFTYGLLWMTRETLMKELGMSENELGV